VKTRLNCRLRPLNTALVLAGLLMAPGFASAQPTDWTAGAGGNWSINANWTNNAPTGAETARLTNEGDQATLNTAGTAASLEIQRGEVIVTTGGSLIASDSIKVGTTGGAGSDALLTIQGGGAVSTTSLIAGDDWGGRVAVTGAGSSLTVAPTGPAPTQRFQVGNTMRGELRIAEGANVTVNGTRTLHLGNVGPGVLFIGSGAGTSAGTLTADSVILGTSNSSVIFFHDGVTTFSAAVSGNGQLIKSGAGTTTLTGANTYTGGTTVSGGTLQGDTTSLQGNITTTTTVNAAIVRFDQAANGTYAGQISGTGSLAKSGAGTLVLTGAHTYTGGTTVSGGILQGNTSSLRGNITNNAAVNFDQAAAGTYSGVMSGSGTFTKLNAGTLTLTGANNYSGGTTISAGTLQGNAVSLRGNITNNAAINFDQTATGTYTGAISGTGTFTKLGAGNLILTGVNTFNGPTTVNAGTLSVNGSISNSAVTVNNGGTLGGNGTLGNTSILGGGVLAPGNSIGTLTVNGNLSFAVGSIYRVEVDAAGANDRINATGTATINGGTVDVQASAGTYQASTQYTILNAAGGRTGNFAGVTSNLAFLTPTLGYDANNVFLTLARNDISFASVAITPNQIAASTALQNAGNVGDMGTVQTALTGLSAAQARAAYDSASGSGIVALRRAGAGFAASFSSQLQGRLGAQANTASGVANSFTRRPVLLAASDHLSDLMSPVTDSPQKFSLAGGASSLSSSPDPAGRGLWVRGYGGYGNTDNDGNAAASRLRSSGLSIGFDAEVKDGVRIGIAATGGTSRLSTDNNESGRTRGTALAVYGSYATGPWNFSGSASMGWGKNHLDRNVVVGTLNRVASSDFDSTTLAAYGEASYSIAMNGWTLQPLAGLSLSRNKADGFTETGAGALNLQVAGQTVNSTKSTLGARASFDAGRIRIEPRALWAHEFGDLNTPMTAQFQGAATASPFQVSGAALKRDTLILGLGASGSIGKGMDFFADVQAEHNSAQRNLAVLVGLRRRW
jgi:outer membrane autotransporter protein